MRREIHQRYSATGWIGVAALAFGTALLAWKFPIVFGLEYDVFGRVRLADRQDVFLFGLGAALLPLSLPLILIGRTYDISEREDQPPQR